jgi:hypothetical protein
MVRSIDPQREILRHAQWPFSPRSLTCLELVLRKTILASVHMRAHLQAEHMDASDLIVTNLQKDLASRGPSTYGRGKRQRIGAATTFARERLDPEGQRTACFARNSHPSL